MTPTGRLVIRLLGAAGVYFALVATWPVAGRAYCNAAAGVLDVSMGNLGWNATARFHPSTGKHGPQITATMNHRKWPTSGDTHIYLYQIYMETMLLFALVLLTPVGWRRRGWALAIGMVLLHVVFYVTIWVSLIHAMVLRSPIDPFNTSNAAKAVLARAHQYLALSPVTALAVPVVIWAGVTFRKGDLQRFVGSANPAASAATTDLVPPAKTR